MGQLESMNGITISKEGSVHKLTIKNCKEGNAGVYRFEAEGRKSEATLITKGKTSNNNFMICLFFYSDHKQPYSITQKCFSPFSSFIFRSTKY